MILERDARVLRRPGHGTEATPAGGPPWRNQWATITSETKLPILVTPLPGPKAKEVIARDAQFVSPSYTRGYPMVAKSGRGAMVEDVDGNVFLDFAAGIAVVSTGHCHPRVVEAIQKQAAELIHISCTDFYLPETWWNLAERLAAVAPGKEAKKVYFGNSGTEAIEAAIKLARYHTRRDKIIAFHGCFHGRTLGALSLTASKAVQRKGFGALLAGVFHIPYPNSYRCPYGNPSPCTCVESATFLETRNLQAPGRSRRSGGDFHRADSGRRRIRPRAEGISRSNCNAFAASTESFWFATKCRAAWDAPGNGGPAITRDRAGHFVCGQGHRLGHAAFRDDCARELDGLEAGRARFDVRRQSSVRRRGAGDDGFAGDAIH